MNIFDILKTVGTGILKQVFPAAGAVIEVVNGFLGDDDKLPSDATGDQIENAIKSLPPDAQKEILSKRLDVKMAEITEWTKVVGSLADADKSGNSTRPWIAKLMAVSVFLTVVGFLMGYVYAVASGNVDILDSIGDSWEIMVAVLATPTALLRSYFGLRTEEKKARYASATGQSHISGIAGMIGSIFRKDK